MSKISRRNYLHWMASLGVGIGTLRCPWTQSLSAAMAGGKTQRQLIVLWMAGGPSQLDTFDLKVGHANGGEFKETATNVPGIRFSEHLPRLAKLADKMAIVRSLQTKEGDHGRGTYLVRTGQRPGSPFRFPAVAASLAKELSTNDPLVPDYVSVLPASFINPMAFGSGFLGPKHQPLTVGMQAGIPSAPNAVVLPDDPVNLRVDNLLPPAAISTERVSRRRDFWNLLQTSYGADQRAGASQSHDTTYRRAMTLSDSSLSEAFDLEREADSIRRSYGNGQFGQGCLMARRLIERGVPVVEVTLGNGGLGWDTHLDNFAGVKQLSQQLDLGWSQLMIDLQERSRLENTTILWIGEFGRTPKINERAGRDHFPDAWTCVLAGGNIAGGQVYGKTSESGEEIIDAKVSIQQILATVSRSVGINPAQENKTEEGRPIKIVEADPIKELLRDS